MKIFLAALLVLLSSLSAAQEQMAFSKHSPGLRLTDLDRAGASATFKGRVKLKGILRFELDSDGKQAADINFAYFEPDAASRANLPAVVAGPSPLPVEYVSLEPALGALIAAVGKAKAEEILHGKVLLFAIPAEVELREFRAGVECDSRAYWSTKFSIKSQPQQLTATPDAEPHGC